MAETSKGSDWIHRSIERMRAFQAEQQSLAPLPEQSRNSARLARTLRVAGVGRSHVRLLLSEQPLQETTALVAAKRFLEQPQKWCLILAGSRGVGKTLASEWLVLQHFSSLKSQSSPMQRVFSTFHVMRSRRDDRLLDKMMTAGLLVLDDLGVEILDHSGAFLWCLFEIINYRWSNRLETVITSNLSPTEIEPRYGHRVVDRFRDGGMCVVAKGSSLR